MIRIFYDNVKYRLRGSKKSLENIEKVIRSENKISGDLNFILCRDESILHINKSYLKHNYYTDVIAFGYGDSGKIEGEVYISIDTVRINSINYKVSLREEILRVMIHGTLHLCGHDDKTKEEKSVMKCLEDEWLKKFKSEDEF